MSRLPVAADFPAKIKLNIVPPPQGDQPTNVLVLLHGLGDNVESFTNLGRQMNLPETVCIALQGPQPLLDTGGFHWGDDIIFDSSSGSVDPDAGFKQTTEILKIIVKDVLRDRCGYKFREILILGYGQGGMAALNLAVALCHGPQVLGNSVMSELGGIISVGGPLPAEAPASLDPRCRTPLLICAGSSQSCFTTSSEDKLQRVFHTVDIKRYRRADDGMPRNRDEMLPIMQFFSQRLRSVKGVPGGSVEVA